MTTNRTWVKRVEIQVRSVLFTATSRTRVRSGDHVSVRIEFLPYELKKKKSPRNVVSPGLGQEVACYLELQDSGHPNFH